MCNFDELLKLHNVDCSPESLNHMIKASKYLRENYVNKKSRVLQHAGGKVESFNYNMNIIFNVTSDNIATTYTLHSKIMKKMVHAS